MAYALGVVLFALGIGLSLALHEAGHLLTAKAFGMRVRRYFVGIGPKVFSFRRGGTEYGLKALPFGGFCEIAGMTTLDELSRDEESRAMYRHRTWKRTVVMLAGPVSHFALGFLILYVMSVTMGLPNTAEKPVLASVSGCVVDDGRTCAPGQLGPAEAAGLKAGDTVVAVAGVATPTWTAMVTRVRAATGPTAIEVERGDARLT